LHLSATSVYKEVFMRSTERVFAFLAVMVLGLNMQGWSQSSTTSLRGTVTDKSGAALVKAEVVLTNTQQAFTRKTTTGQAGEYEFLQVPPGTYELSVQMKGFRRYTQKDLQLLVSNPATANVTLEIGTASEVVEVTGEAALVNTTDASLGTAFNERQIRALPLEGRNVPDLLTLQAGVTYTGNRPDVNRDVDTRSGAVNGARSDQSNITLDGVDVND
jgi:hypothetical protein